MIEIGSACGEAAEIFLSLNPALHIICVDPWNNEAHYAAWKQRHGKNPRVKALRLTSQEASRDDDLRYWARAVYIDGNHEYDFVVDDIYNWSYAIHPECRIGGHDYAPRFPGVIDAVNECAHGNKVLTFDDTSWLYAE